MHDSLLYLSGDSAELKDNDSFWGESQSSSNPSERWHTHFPLRFAFHLQAHHLGSVALWKYKHGGQGRGHSIAPHKAFSPLPPEVSYKSFSLKKLMESNLSGTACCYPWRFPKLCWEDLERGSVISGWCVSICHKMAQNSQRRRELGV